MLTALLLSLLFISLAYFSLKFYLVKSWHPTSLAKNKNPQGILLLGDSNTRGNMAYDWSQDLPFENINEGVNADLSHNLTQRLSKYKNLNISGVVVLIGTNNVNAAFHRKRYEERGKISRDTVLNQAIYATHLREIAAFFNELPMAFASLPLMGEKLDSEIQKSADAYSDLIKEVAKDYGKDFIDLRSWMKENSAGEESPSFHTYFGRMQKNMMLHYFFGVSWNTISAWNGTYLLHDLLHLNKTAGSKLALLITEWKQKYV